MHKHDWLHSKTMNFSKAITIIILVVLFVGLVPKAVSAEENNIQSQLSSGISYSNIENEIDGFVAEHKDTTAGMSVSVFTSNDILMEKSYGHANIEDNVINDADTVFMWGSVTKLLVWVSVMQLVEQEKLDLNSDIRAYLPDGFFKKLKYEDPITMLNLMNHNAGWQDVYVDTEPITDIDAKRLDLGAAVKKLEPAQVFRPGEYTAYSNYGASLAGYIVERISGKPFYQYVHDNIFDLLGMKQTALNYDLSDNQRVKQQRQKISSYTSDLQNLGSAPYSMSIYPCGQATGTISDLRIFATALLPDERGSSPLFINPNTLTEMYSPTSYFPGEKDAKFCHGFLSFSHLNGFVIGHGGNTAGFSSMLVIDPFSGVGAVVMTNQEGEGIYNYKMLTHIFGDKSFSDEGINVDKPNIIGIYYGAQGMFRGSLKIAGITGVLPIVKGKDDAPSIPMGGYTIEYVEQGIYKMAISNGMTLLVYPDIDSDGNVSRLSYATGDYIRTSWVATIFGILTVLFFVIAGLYGLVSLIIMLIRRLRKKKQPMDGLLTVSCATMLATIVNIAVMIILASSYVSTFTVMTVQGILFIALTLILVATSVIMAILMKKFNLIKRQKRQIVTTAVIGLLVSIDIIYWQLYMFWI